jgi:DnaJ-class molecular chaperone
VDVTTPDGKVLSLKIPTLTRPGTRFKIAGKGNTVGRKKGDMIVTVDAKMPREVPEDVMRVLESLKWRL